MKSHRSSALLLLVALLSSCAVAQEDPNPAAIARLRHAKVSDIEKGMPSIEFEKWFAELANPQAVITYESNDCGERNGTPDERGKTFPLCVFVRAEGQNSKRIELTFVVGNYVASPDAKPKLKGNPQLFYAEILKNAELVSSPRSLAGVAHAWAALRR